MWAITVNFAAIKLVFLSHFAQNKYLLTGIMKPADYLGWNQISTIIFFTGMFAVNNMQKKTQKGLLWQNLVCLQKMPVTGTRHKSHNLSSDLTASPPFAFLKPYQLTSFYQLQKLFDEQSPFMGLKQYLLQMWEWLSLYSFRFQNNSFLFGLDWSVRLGPSVS